MTDQTIPANLTRKEAQAVREWAERAWNTKVQDATVAHAARVLLAVLPPRPTLADMTAEERDACRWMQADSESWGRVVILNPCAIGGNVTLVDDRGAAFPENHARVTPRPDLPRMAWPGDTEAAPAPALPGDWRLADHKEHGRGIVTNPTPNPSGRVYFVIPADDPMGYDWLFCTPDELTYIEQGDDQ